MNIGKKWKVATAEIPGPHSEYALSLPGRRLFLSCETSHLLLISAD